MSDIFGRSTIAHTDVITKKEILSMIRKYVTSRLNLVDVDPGEIVVFGDKQGKLKTSNLSLDDLLTKSSNAEDDSIVVFKSGKLAPSHNIKTLDKIAEVETDLETHMKDYKQFRRNVIIKFFGTPLVVTPSLTEIKNSIDDIKQNIADIKRVTEKVKIPHNVLEIEGVSYVVSKRFDIEYLQPTPEMRNRIILLLSGDRKITGIYRFSLISEYQFNIKISHSDSSPFTFLSQGVNVVLFKFENKSCRYEITPVDPGVVRATYSYIVEYLSPI